MSMHSKWTDDYYAGLRIHESGNQRVEVEMVLLFITPRDFMGEFVLPIPTSSQIGISTKEIVRFSLNLRLRLLPDHSELLVPV